MSVSTDTHLTEILMDSKGKNETIPEVFHGKKILLTGATGFVGKVLLEKLLRSCPGISAIILIMRTDKFATRQQRHDRLMQHRIFDRLKQEYPNALQKVYSVEGNIELENLGVEASVMRTVSEEISFVFHCAANVRFDCNPKLTLNINLVGVKYLLELCKKMPKLEAVVHVSTAYSFCNQPVIGEEIYPEKFGPDRILEALTWMKQNQLMHLSDYVIKGRPSLYHVSKALSEILISERRGNLPIVIVRPSIVTAAVSEPYPGWVDNYNGPSGFIALSSKGILKTLLINEEIKADWVPVDIVANTLIVAAHRMALRQNFEDPSYQRRFSDVPIINCVCPENNLTTWSNIVDICLPIILEYPSATVYRVPGGYVTSSPTVHGMCKCLFHFIPAFIVDVICLCLWIDFGLLDTYSRIHIVLNHLQLYTTRPFYFTSRNMQYLSRQMSAEDRREFPIDQSRLDWQQYMEVYVRGVRRYFLREKDESLPAARRRVKILQTINKALLIVPTVTGLYILTKCVIKPNLSTVKDATYKLFGYCSQVLTKMSFV